MEPDDPRHGEYAGAIQHYMERSETCRPCKDAAAAYRRNQRARKYLARGPLTVPATGTNRRIYALCALGYHMREIDRALGKQFGFCSQLKRYPVVHRKTAVAVAEVYDRWCGTVPEETPLRSRQRKIAAARGWAPPLAWDAIDDPNAKPRGVIGSQKVYRPHHEIDHAVVDRLLEGQVIREATNAERKEAMRRWLAMGNSERSLCRILGWKDGRYVQRGAAA